MQIASFRHARPYLLRPLAVGLCLGLLGSGCSIKKMAVKTMADALSEGASGFGTDDDPQLVKDALPFGLKTLESMLAQLPKHRPLLRAVSSGFTSYATAFIVPEIRGLEDIDLATARAERTRAKRMFLRARDYGLRALEVPYPGFGAELRADPVKAVGRTKKEDIADLYWTAAAWGSAISVGKDDMDLVADVNIVEALIRRAYQLDEAWEAGAIHEFLITFESRGETMGGSLERARTHFARAMELAGGRRVSPLVSLAENVSIQTQNRAEFDKLLDQALEFDADRAPETRLYNLIAQRRARQLKALAGDLFLEEK